MPGTQVLVQSELIAIRAISVNDTDKLFLQERLSFVSGRHVAIIHMQEQIQSTATQVLHSVIAQRRNGNGKLLSGGHDSF